MKNLETKQSMIQLTTLLPCLDTIQAPLQPELTTFYDFVQPIGDNLF